MSEKICAVVVTFNRIELLKECIESLRTQTQKLDEIIIVNNASSDGTKEWLDQQNDITAIHQENLGGAGGFHNGIKAAYEKGHDWIWCMDDDCLPNKDSLEKLFTTSYKENALLNSLVLNKTNPHELTFDLYEYKTKKLYRTYEEIRNKKIINAANLFNGTLIHRKVVDKVGYPESSFFIYGDDYEYFMRIKGNSIPIATVVESIVKHPPQKHVYVGKWRFFYRINYFNLLGVKYFPRNIMAIWYYYDEFSFQKLLKTYFYDLFGILFIQKQFSLFVRYIFSIIQGPHFILIIRKQRTKIHKRN